MLCGDERVKRDMAKTVDIGIDENSKYLFLLPLILTQILKKIYNILAIFSL